MTEKIIHFLYALAIQPRSQKPRALISFFLYYFTGLFVSLLVLSMVLLCLEVYNFPFTRNFIYQHLGEGILQGLENIFF